MRAIHFFDENDRVDTAANALRENDTEGFLNVVLASGRSSFCYLQNVFTPKSTREQGISLALCIAQGYLSDKNAAFRVHGGGFAGTIQAFVPTCHAEGFCKAMNEVFGAGACSILKIRDIGAVKII
jgi:galactokinase